MTDCYICASAPIGDYDLCFECRTSLYSECVKIEERMIKIVNQYRLRQNTVIIEKLLQNMSLIEIRRMKYIDSRTHKTNVQFLAQFIEEQTGSNTEWFEI